MTATFTAADQSRGRGGSLAGTVLAPASRKRDTMASSFWGVLAGGGVGFAVGGPLGALIGAVAGHLLVDREGSPFGPPPKELIFTTGLVALAAKMARSDGVVTSDEVTAFRKIIDVPPDELPRVERLFDLAKETTDGFDAYAAQIADVFKDEPDLLESVLDGLFLIAAADGALHEAEGAYLRDVGRIFAISEKDFARIEARHVRRKDDPYLQIGAERGWSDKQLRSHYLQQVVQSHPDRQIALGLPVEAVRIATDRLAVINAAWDRIQLERGMTTKGQSLELQD
jgi:DnaJ like chaperone protein